MRHKIINLVHPDVAETPYGWAFENFYDAREHLKALSNKTGDNKATSKPNASTICELEKMCTRCAQGGLGLELSC
jgi:hypothetical protein